MNSIQTFFKRIKKVNECWEWQGKLTNGYGSFCYKGKGSTAHRISYQLLRGTIPQGLHIDHLCRNRRCVNPSHLEAVTPAENALRGEGIPAKNKRKTECLNGHKFDEKNTYYGEKGRWCKECNKVRSKELLKNPEARIRQNISKYKWRQKNKERIKKYNGMYRLKHLHSRDNPHTTEA